MSQQTQEIEQLIQQVSRELDKLGNPLWDFVKWEVRPAARRLFEEWDITVYELHNEVLVKRAGGLLEIDLFLVNDTQAVLIKAQDQLTQRDVDQHLERLAKFKQFMPRYRDTQALGAVAAMVVTDEVADYAYRQGLFVLAQSGENVVILNNSGFQPQVW